MGLTFRQMVAIAKTKMPTGLPPFARENKYHYIISTYTLHHLMDKDKLNLIKNLLPLLTEI